MECVFCAIVAGTIPSDRVYEDETVIAFRDINPVAETHVLIIPKRHVATALDVPDDETPLFADLYRAANAIARRDGLTGFKLQMNVGEGGGQVVPHVHLHLIAGPWHSDRRTV